MAGNWTREQLEAIMQRGCNLLVAAAAGAGKTAVLVERIIRKITDGEKPVDIDKLLVVTFTNAAATEMRDRIGSALADALEADSSSANLQKQMALLDRASIMTLHSFCLEIVRSHFQDLDLDPVFRIADETEATLMKQDVLEELFEDKYENEDAESNFFKLVESYGGGRDDNSLREIVLMLHRFTSSYPWPGQWLAAQAEAYNTGASACLSSTPWARVLLKSAAAELQGLAALLGKAAAPASREQGLEPYCGALEEDLRQLDKLLQLCRSAGCDDDCVATACSIDSAVAVAVPANETAAPAAHTMAPDSYVIAQASTAAPAPAFDWDTIHAAFSSFEPARLPRCGKNADKDAQEEVKAVRNLMKDKLKKLCESGFNATEAEITGDFRKLYPLFKYLSDMVCEFDARYLQKKKEKGLLDFNDLEHYCLKVLLENGQPTAAARELREKYEEILVDEYQDSNLIQELILGTVSGVQDGRYNLFMVGDVKQSIYRFRQARPELFLSKYAAYPHESGYDSRVIQLYKNFRSRPEVINGVNFIFKQIMSSLVGELDYTDEEALNPGAVFNEPETGCNVGGPIELHIIDVTSAQTEILPEGQDNAIHAEITKSEHAGKNDIAASDHLVSGSSTNTANGSNADTENDNCSDPDSSSETDEEPLDNIQTEARIVGKRIRSLVSRSKEGLNVYDKKLSGYRPAEYMDIVILMRATRNWADVFTDELAAMGIPAYADTGLGYFRTVEVETMLSLLQIIDNPLQDIPLIAVLRSPICNFSEDELADIRLADRSASFYEAMKAFSNTNDGFDDPERSKTANIFGSDIRNTAADSPNDGQQKTDRFLQQLEIWRNDAQVMPTDELVWKLLIDTGYYSYAGVLPGGSERQANLRMLFERARQYEETSYKGLFNFINFIGKLRSGGGDMGSAKILGENDNVVRIMSIHKSKGLEFPVVIVAGCGKKFNMRDLNASILLHQDLGFGPDLVDLEKRTITLTLPKSAIRQKLRLETLSEEMRILYVAFTRAKEKLIITGCVRGIAKNCAKWCSIADTKDEKLPQYDMQQASTYLDWLGPAVARHESAEPVRLAAAPCGNIALMQEERSRWEVKLWGAGAAAAGREAEAANENIRQWLEEDAEHDGTAAIADSSGYDSEQLIRRLEWQYPYRTLSTMPAKLSVTELKRRFEGEGLSEEAAMPFTQPMVERPLFMEPKKGLGAARKGTVMHFVMQHIDLKRLTAGAPAVSLPGQSINNALNNELQSQLSSMVADEQLTAEEAETVDIKAISVFFGTALGKRMLNAASVHRETAFNIEIKCTEIYKELPDDLYGNETMLLQGVIDCWFEADNGLVLLDYKTDYVLAGGAERIRERYRIQLDYYTRALEKITGRKVTEKYLYLFHTGELLKC
ncbi:MAG: UvrD-helicase domain-containing protein [Clostridiaceae bacterium]